MLRFPSFPVWCFTLVGALLASTVQAAKPAPPPPPPSPTLSGIIFYTTDNGELWGMKPDGTSQTRVLSTVPTGTGIPCFHPQGGDVFRDRWFVGLLPTPGKVYDIRISATGAILAPQPHYDVYAFRTTPGSTSQFEYVQLTDLFGSFVFVGGQASWSNGSNDDLATSFVGCGGRDIRDAFYIDEDGQAVVDFRDAVTADLRLPVTAGEIQDGWVNNNFVPFSPADPADLDPLLAPYHEGLWGGDTKAMNSDSTLLVSPGGGQVRLLNLLDNSSLVIWNGANGEPTRPDAFDFTNVPAWSPDNQSILVINEIAREARGGIWKLSQNGSTPVQLGKNYYKQTSDYYTWRNVYWSPDSQYVMCNRTGYKKGNNYFRDIVLLTASNGTSVKEFPNFSGWPKRWVSASPAP